MLRLPGVGVVSIVWRAVILSTLAAGAPAYPAVAAVVYSDVWLLVEGGDLISDSDGTSDTVGDAQRSASAALELPGLWGASAGNVTTGWYSTTLAKSASGDAEATAGTSASFVARGSGVVNFRFDTRATWNVSSAGSSDWTYLESTMGLFSRDTNVVGLRANDVVDSVNEPFTVIGDRSAPLAFSAMVRDGETYDLDAGLTSWLLGGMTGTASLDATLSYAAADGVRLAFDDPEFLIAPVPLPSAGLLLVAGLFGLALLARRTDSAAVAVAA